MDVADAHDSSPYAFERLNVWEYNARGRFTNVRPSLPVESTAWCCLADLVESVLPIPEKP